jgi:hypothetical protein
MKVLLAVIVSALTLFLAACATPFVPGKIPDGAKLLSGAEINVVTQRAVAQAWQFDNAFDGGLTYQLQANGVLKISSRYVSKVIMGSWRVDQTTGLLCARIENDPESCSQFFEVVPDRSYYLDVEGASLQDNTLTVRR